MSHSLLSVLKHYFKNIDCLLSRSWCSFLPSHSLQMNKPLWEFFLSLDKGVWKCNIIYSVKPDRSDLSLLYVWIGFKCSRNGCTGLHTPSLFSILELILEIFDGHSISKRVLVQLTSEETKYLLREYEHLSSHSSDAVVQFLKFCLSDNSLFKPSLSKKVKYFLGNMAISLMQQKSVKSRKYWLDKWSMMHFYHLKKMSSVSFGFLSINKLWNLIAINV